MSSTQKVPVQGIIFYLTGRLIFGCRFFSFSDLKTFQAACFGAESRPLLAG